MLVILSPTAVDPPVHKVKTDILSSLEPIPNNPLYFGLITTRFSVYVCLTQTLFIMNNVIYRRLDNYLDMGSLPILDLANAYIAIAADLLRIGRAGTNTAGKLCYEIRY